MDPGSIVEKIIGKPKKMHGYRKLDGTGPQGLGPMTGRGMGRCKIEIEAENEKED